MSILSYILGEHDLPLPQLPPSLWPLQPLLLSWLCAVLDCFGRSYLAALARRYSHHPLVRLAACYDPSSVIDRCAHYYHHAGPGNKPTYSVGLLVRAEIVRVWAGSCSDPCLERIIATDLIVRWYVGLGLTDPSPDHTTLNRFHRWLAQHHPDALFFDVLAFLDRVDPEPVQQTPQLVDTFALAAPAAHRGLAELLCDLSRQLLRSIDQQAPHLRAVLDGLDLSLLSKLRPLRAPEQRLVQLRAAVAIAQALQERLSPLLPALAAPTAHALQTQLELIAKVLADEISTNVAGEVVERPLGQKGSHRLASAVDVEATYRKHEGSPAVLGYNAAIASTKSRIRGVVLLAGSTPDSEAPLALLAQQKQAGLLLPERMVMDQAGGYGKTRADVAGSSGGQTTMVARTPAASNDQGRYGPADFKLSSDGGSISCPNGVTSMSASRGGGGAGVQFIFTSRQCAGCPLWAACRGAQSKPRSMRRVFISAYHEYLRRAAEFNASERGQELLGQRWQVEAMIAWLVRYDGCRRARRVGKQAAQLHLLQGCAVRNLWRYLGRVARRMGQSLAASQEGVCP